MFYTSCDNQKLYDNFKVIGLEHKINNHDVLIKINLTRPCVPLITRTDMTLLKTVVDYIYQNGGRCAITEGAGGYLKENLIAYGFEDTLKYYNVKVIDVELEDCEEVVSYGEYHYIPKCFKEYFVRIAMPYTSKRDGMIFSNNIKCFFGAVPKKMYQLDNPSELIGIPRPRLHQNLHLSVANLFMAMNDFSRFHFYINGGFSFNENIGSFPLNETFIGDDALELDLFLFQKYFSDCEYPSYLDILKNSVLCAVKGGNNAHLK